MLFTPDLKTRTADHPCISVSDAEFHRLTAAESQHTETPHPSMKDEAPLLSRRYPLSTVGSLTS